MGAGDRSNQTIAALYSMLEDSALDVLIHNGDISYADGYERHFDDFFRKVEPIVSRIPYMVSPGKYSYSLDAYLFYLH